MEKTLTKSVALFGALAIILASCSRDNSVVSNNRVFSKHKHTKGFHLNLKKDLKAASDEMAKNETPRFIQNEAVDLSTAKSYTISTENNRIENEIYATVETPKNSSEAFINSKVETKKSFVLNNPSNNFIKSNSIQTNDVKTNSVKKSEVKATVKSELKKAKKNSALEPILYILLAIFIPFVAVGLATDWNVKDVVINLLLTLLCGIPGIIHAFIVCNREGVI